ncbi:MAG: hypothetical protein LBI71_00085 [Enterobacteriaceae bacterium]|jgi:hypothetical protein|nr:hypothetical protein [Enterobacteriaceae bacterium]
MSDVNLLASTVCSFKPEQFHPEVTYTATMTLEDVFVAPLYSFAWAMNNLFRGHPVSRNTWPTDSYLIPEYNGPQNITNILQVTGGNTIFPWAISRQDMLSCNWELYDNYMLSFDLTSDAGVDTVNNQKDWGYISPTGYLTGNESPFGTLAGLKTSTDVASIAMFFYREPQNAIWMKLVASPNNEQKVTELLNKNLTVTVDARIYNLGSYSPDWSLNAGTYSNDDAIKLGTVLKQTGTKTFGFNWE